jgi:hypothetical protein
MVARQFYEIRRRLHRRQFRGKIKGALGIGLSELDDFVIVVLNPRLRNSSASTNSSTARIALVNSIIEALRQQRRLPPIRHLNEALHDFPRRFDKGILASMRVSTRAGPEPVLSARSITSIATTAPAPPARRTSSLRLVGKSPLMPPNRAFGPSRAAQLPGLRRILRSGKEPLALPNVVVGGQLSWDSSKDRDSCDLNH